MFLYLARIDEPRFNLTHPERFEAGRAELPRIDMCTIRDREGFNARRRATEHAFSLGLSQLNHSTCSALGGEGDDESILQTNQPIVEFFLWRIRSAGSHLRSLI